MPLQSNYIVKKHVEPGTTRQGKDEYIQLNSPSPLYPYATPVRTHQRQVYSPLASFCQVSRIESGLSEIDSIPSAISHCAKSG